MRYGWFSILLLLLGFFLFFSLIRKEEIFKAIYSLALSIILSIAIFFIDFYFYISQIKKMEEMFPEFLSSLSSALKSGMTITQAFKHTSGLKLGPLTPLIKKAFYKLSWGIPFPKVIKDLQKSIPSKEIKNALSVIRESYYIGGELVKTLDTLSDSLRRIREIKKDIQTTLGEHLKVIYTINFLFMVILIVMYNVLIPLQIYGVEGTEEFGLTLRINVEKYKLSFLAFGIVVGACSGVLAGTIVGEKITEGLKHALILVCINTILLSFLIVRKSIIFEINFPPEIEVGRVYKIEGTLLIEGEPCSGRFIIEEWNKSGIISNGKFFFSIKFLEKGKKEATFVAICGKERVKRKINIEVK